MNIKPIKEYCFYEDALLDIIIKKYYTAEVYFRLERRVSTIVPRANLSSHFSRDEDWIFDE